MKIELSAFGGMAPLVAPVALAEKLSTRAYNVRFDRGVLSPSNFQMVEAPDYPDVDMSGLTVRAVGKFFEDGTRFAFANKQADTAFPSPVAPVDAWGRVYFMSDSGPAYVTTDQYSRGYMNVEPVSFRLGVPAPAAAPSVANADVVVDLEDADEINVLYAYSFVDTYGHEGPLSPASRSVTLAYDRTFSVTVGLSDSPPDNVAMEQGLRRVYRATFDGTTSVFQYLIDVPISSESFVDTLPIGQEGEEAVSTTWWPADPRMQQLCLVGSAFAAGILDHYLCYSESRLPHAWPYELQYPLKYAPVKLLPMTNGLLVCTTGRPYWASGTDPYSAYPQEMAANLPCTAPDSVVDMGGYAIYASHVGLVMVEPTTSAVKVVSSEFIDRAGMDELIGEDCTAFEYDGRYVFSTLDNRWLAFSPGDGFTEVNFGFAPNQFESVSFNIRDNRHFFSLVGGGVRQVDFHGEATDAEWHSKHLVTPPVGFSCLRVLASRYPVDVLVRAQYLGGEWQEMTVTSDGPGITRLPNYYGTLWQLQISLPAGGEIYTVTLAQSGSEVI